MFLSTTGDVLDPEQQAAFEGYIRNGGGYVGIHSAADTEYDWAWYGGLVGAYFLSHPEPQDATLLVEDHVHESTAHTSATRGSASTSGTTSVTTPATGCTCS